MDTAGVAVDVEKDGCPVWYKVFKGRSFAHVECINPEDISLEEVYLKAMILLAYHLDLMHLATKHMPIYPIKAVTATTNRSPHQFARSMRPSA